MKYWTSQYSSPMYSLLRLNEKRASRDLEKKKDIDILLMDKKNNLCSAFHISLATRAHTCESQSHACGHPNQSNAEFVLYTHAIEQLVSPLHCATSTRMCA
jgi:hypothetical protein